jgi:hypothetical protein
MNTILKVGDRVRFAAQKAKFKVRAAGERFAICTIPYNPKHTVIYTIIDFREGVRGPENLVFGMGAETDEQCREMLARLESGQSQVSHRNRIPLDIVA